MSEHHATIHWQKTTASFGYEDYNRDHEWRFDDGFTVVDASAAPAFRGTAERVDPEEAFVAALSSCHMLTFLAICSRKKIVVESYVDDAVGHLEKNTEGQLVITRVELHPRIAFGAGQAPDAGVLRELHESAHKACFLANSVKTDVRLVEAG
jgi:organic hydroperoxide reductase OsmC/OhrA